MKNLILIVLISSLTNCDHVKRVEDLQVKLSTCQSERQYELSHKQYCEIQRDSYKEVLSKLHAELPK